MTETEPIGAIPAPKRRRAARKAADTPESATPKPRAGGRRTSAGQPRTRGRRAAATPPPGTIALVSGLGTAEPPAAEPVATSFGAEAEPAPGQLAEAAAGKTTPELVPPVESPAAALQDAPGQPASGGLAAPEHASPTRRIDFPPADVRHPVSRSRPARPTFKQTVLRAAEERFRGDRVREPVTAEQVDEMLVLLHEPGQSRSLKGATYDFLRRGMSKRHAEVQLKKLRGTFGPADERTAA